MKLTKQKTQRIQVVIGQDRHDQLTKLREFTGLKISTIVRMILDEQAERLDKEITRARRESAQEDFAK